ncbi:MAG: hypothetical protein F4Y00_05710 [Bacteroidetes bacterium SB0662_bin_6]|nr:hypothetical protein [Bacteroidetes bacterium SB0668_bin_1]MYE04452.1 hypothetical protein [Bacteroidetes bacterium SB0662_bin_6]
MTNASDVPRTAGVRQALLDQLAYLIDETAVLREHVGRIPESVLKGRPIESELSFLEMYVSLYLFDQKVYSPAVARLAEGKDVSLDVPGEREMLDDAAPEHTEIEAVLDHISTARTGLATLFSGLDVHAWRTPVTINGAVTDVFGLAHHVIRHDVDLLRRAATRLHESRLTSRREDIPK